MGSTGTDPSHWLTAKVGATLGGHRLPCGAMLLQGLHSQRERALPAVPRRRPKGQPAAPFRGAFVCALRAADHSGETRLTIQPNTQHAAFPLRILVETELAVFLKQWLPQFPSVAIIRLTCWMAQNSRNCLSHSLEARGLTHGVSKIASGGPGGGHVPHSFQLLVAAPSASMATCLPLFCLWLPLSEFILSAFRTTR